MPAIFNERGLFARNVKTSGYAMAIQNGDGTKQNARGPEVDEFVSHPVLTLFPGTPTRSLQLPVRDVPEPPQRGPKDWVSIRDFEPKQVKLTRKDKQNREITDWTPALQAAIDSGAKVVYFPPGSYHLHGEIYLRGNVERIDGMDTNLDKMFGDFHPIFVTAEGTSPVVVLENFDAIYSGALIRHEAKRSLVVRSWADTEHVSITKAPGSGDLFLSDVCVGHLDLQGGNTWARQLDLEGEATFKTKLRNDGGTLWMLGYKTEGDAVLLHGVNGSRSEIVGGFIYANKANRPDKEMFLVEDSDISFTIGEWVGRKQPFHPVTEVRGGERRVLRHGDAPGRGEGSMVPLFVGVGAPTR